MGPNLHFPGFIIEKTISYFRMALSLFVSHLKLDVRLPFLVFLRGKFIR